MSCSSSIWVHSEFEAIDLGDHRLNRRFTLIATHLARQALTVHDPAAVAMTPARVKPLTAARDGFSLHAAVVCGAEQRDKLERLCRYVSRGPLALERLSIDGDGLVVHALKHPFRDGTTQILFEPLDFIARLAALLPRPRAHLVRYL